ncbi:MAG: hypothetical protein EOM20_05465 [Spartobacteria bacterium]|nr:hypothetical protein [Spartobacteria bacterium]
MISLVLQVLTAQKALCGSFSTVFEALRGQKWPFLGFFSTKRPFFGKFSAFFTEIGRFRPFSARNLCVSLCAAGYICTANSNALRRAMRTLVIEDNDPPGELDAA